MSNLFPNPYYILQQQFLSFQLILMLEANDMTSMLKWNFKGILNPPEVAFPLSCLIEELGE